MKLIEVFTKPKGKIKWSKRTSKAWAGDFEVEDPEVPPDFADNGDFANNGDFA